MHMEDDQTKPYHHGDLRRTLLDTASQMLRQEQNWQFTLREVARRAGVSHAAPYKHFADKQALLDELALQGFEHLGRELRAAQASSHRGIKALFTAAARAYIAFAQANQAQYRLMFSSASTTTPSLHLNERAMATLSVLLEVIQRGQQEGIFKKRPIKHQAAACWAQVHGLAMLQIDGLLVPQKVGEDPVTGALATLLDGLLS